ncbi:hypothetical protein A5819_003548 [Enterococcus sp. 7E2_DIV0204]|uniref:hypothetical protein n=1 Tax=unclassified Enterococcus TaxID=2608891 RepID=UPI000A33BA82|nr:MULTISPECIES: hypothetical protein [unclassified Enterococcus]OTN83998.1 hypothetical protein A5819_003548 [Enterococcus sp. 7E2_DIV0204]OTP47219.1 hypothetical protein A5884_003594 [Enterococcus sp. 7D2_DIV0200]
MALLSDREAWELMIDSVNKGLSENGKLYKVGTPVCISESLLSIENGKIPIFDLVRRGRYEGFVGVQIVSSDSGYFVNIKDSEGKSLPIPREFVTDLPETEFIYSIEEYVFDYPEVVWGNKENK